MKKIPTFIGQTIVLGFVLGIIDLILIILMGISNMGGAEASASTGSWNQVLGSIVGFPILIFFDLNFKNWPFGIFDIINLLAKAAIILAIANGITRLRNKQT